MRNFLLAAIVMLFFAMCPAFAQCANGVCRAPQFAFQQQTSCMNGQCSANGQCSTGSCANGQCSVGNQCTQSFSRTTVMATHMPVRNAVRFMPFRRLFR